MSNHERLLALISGADISESQEDIFLDILERRLTSLFTENKELKVINIKLEKDYKDLKKKYDILESNCDARVRGNSEAYEKLKDELLEKSKIEEKETKRIVELLKKEIIVSFEFVAETGKYQVINSYNNGFRETELYFSKDEQTLSKIGTTVKRKI